MLRRPSSYANTPRCTRLRSANVMGSAVYSGNLALALLPAPMNQIPCREQLSPSIENAFAAVISYGACDGGVEAHGYASERRPAVLIAIFLLRAAGLRLCRPNLRIRDSPVKNVKR